MSNELIVEFLSDGNLDLPKLTLFGDGKLYVLKENGHYEYELSSDRYTLKEKSRVIRRSRISKGCERGFIDTGNYVGLLNLELQDKVTKKTISSRYIEVCSTKLNYDSEYRYMLEDIADRCADFLLQIESPVDQTFVPDDEATDATLAQRLYFLKSLLGNEEFQQAIQRIVSEPNTRWLDTFRSIDVRRSRRLGRYEVRQFASAARRIKVPSTHALSSCMNTLPEKIEIRDKRDTVDTLENRFVKYALNIFLQTLEDLLSKFLPTGNKKYPELRGEVNELITYLEETLSHDVFKQVSKAKLLPLNSPVLQRKEGYRQVLRAWMLFDLAAKLSWTGGDDVYEGGKRDAASLYEYWVFFRLLDIVAETFELNNPPVQDLINAEDLVLKLKAGKQLPIKGIYKGAGRHLNIEFSYNRTFSSSNSYPSGGSWTRRMRPDYTLSLWPLGFNQSDAEKQEVITHVHFDAKYKVNKLVELFGKDDDELNEEKAMQRVGNYKHADLLKMHAYRDAIRRSAGAYVLYPGSEKANFHGFHELLPGLGAFPLRPNKTEDGSTDIENFFKEIVAHVCNRATQHEQQTYHTYKIHKDQPPAAVRDAMPETIGESRIRPVTEDYIIHGWIKGSDHLDWVKSRGLYNFRTDTSRGSLRLHKSVAGASYLLLHSTNQYQGGGQLFRIISEGPRVFSKESLLAKNYPGSCSQLYYLVYDVKPLAASDALAAYDWDLSQIDGINDNRQSPIPTKGITLNELMKGAKKK